jgi:hypothetical protein
VSVEGAGAPEITEVVIPNGLDWESVTEAVAIVELWEITGDGTATDLVLDCIVSLGPALDLEGTGLADSEE